jgi:hypothetical protein
MKICTKCEKQKELSEFHKDRTTKDGLYPNCKECKKEYYISDDSLALSRVRYQKNILKERERSRSKTSKKYSEFTEEEKARAYLANKRFMQKNKKVACAYQKTHYHLRKGTITKLPCEECGTEDAQAHHEDYNNPLEITWLCRNCHHTHHVEQRELQLTPSKCH